MKKEVFSIFCMAIFVLNTAEANTLRRITLSVSDARTEKIYEMCFGDEYVEHTKNHVSAITEIVNLLRGEKIKKACSKNVKKGVELAASYFDDSANAFHAISNANDSANVIVLNEKLSKNLEKNKDIIRNSFIELEKNSGLEEELKILKKASSKITELENQAPKYSSVSSVYGAYNNYFMLLEYCGLKNPEKINKSDEENLSFPAEPAS